MGDPTSRVASPVSEIPTGKNFEPTAVSHRSKIWLVVGILAPVSLVKWGLILSPLSKRKGEKPLLTLQVLPMCTSQQQLGELDYEAEQIVGVWWPVVFSLKTNQLIIWYLWKKFLQAGGGGFPLNLFIFFVRFKISLKQTKHQSHSIKAFESSRGEPQAQSQDCLHLSQNTSVSKLGFAWWWRNEWVVGWTESIVASSCVCTWAGWSF